MAAVAEGDTKGLCFEVKQLWTQLGRPDAWEAKNFNSDTKKNELKGAAKNLMQRGLMLGFELTAEQTETTPSFATTATTPQRGTSEMGQNYRLA